MVGSLVGGGGGTALVPVIEPLGQMVQDCFAMPAGATFTEYFLEKNIKVLTTSFMFGEISMNFQELFIGNRRFRACLLVSFYSISIFLILMDHKYS